MPSILEPLRRTSKFDTNEERCGEACGRRWASMFASHAQLSALAAIAKCPLSWFGEHDEKSLITSDRLVEIMCDHAQSTFHKRGFWDRNFGSSARHIAIRNTPMFAHGFVIGAVSITSPEWPHALIGLSAPGSFLAIERCKHKQLEWRTSRSHQNGRTDPAAPNRSTGISHPRLRPSCASDDRR